MKKMNFKMIFFMTMLFVFTTITTCFADVYIPGQETLKTEPYFAYDLTYFGPFLGNLFIIGAIILFIDLICMLAGKIIKLEFLIEKTKKIFKNIFYCLLIIYVLLMSAGIVYDLTMIVRDYLKAIIFNILPFIIIFISVFFKLKSKKIMASYGILIIYILFLSALIYTPLDNILYL